MKKINLTIGNDSAKRYLNIANGIRMAIKNGQVAPMEKLPSARKLAEQLTVNRHTVMAAYQELEAQGWVEAKERQGYCAAASLPIDSSITLNRAKGRDSHRHQWRLNSNHPLLTSAQQRPASQYPFNFAGGNPDIELFPFNDFRIYVNESLNRPSIKELNYGDNSGFKPFIEQVSTYLRRVRGIVNKEVVVVNGTQEALYIIAQLMIKSGDKVAVESLGYRPAWNAFKSAGANLIGVQQNSQGVDVTHLEQLFKQHKIRLLYLTPLHQYPTTTTLQLAKRVAIYQLAQQYNVPIIEDDYDHEFHYTSQPLAPMAANDPSGLIIYLSSFSKIMFPGIRLGVIAVDKSLAPHLVNYRTLINHKANVVMQDAVARWMADGAFERHLRKVTRHYQKRQQFMLDLLNRFTDEGIELDFTTPSGGMAFWVNVGKNATRISHLAKEKGIYLLAESAFHLSPENNQDKFIRLGFAGQSEAKTQQGLNLLKPLLRDLT